MKNVRLPRLMSLLIEKCPHRIYRLHKEKSSDTLYQSYCSLLELYANFNTKLYGYPNFCTGTQFFVYPCLKKYTPRIKSIPFKLFIIKFYHQMAYFSYNPPYNHNLEPFYDLHHM